MLYTALDNDTFAGVDEFRTGTAHVSFFHGCCLMSFSTRNCFQDDTFHAQVSLMWQAKVIFHSNICWHLGIDIFQIQLFCSGWPFPGRPKKTLQTDFPLVWVTADYDLKYVFPCVVYEARSSGI